MPLCFQTVAVMSSHTSAGWSLCLLEEAWLLFDVVLLVPLPPDSLHVLNTLLLCGCHLQVPFFKVPT